MVNNLLQEKVEKEAALAELHRQILAGHTILMLSVSKSKSWSRNCPLSSRNWTTSRRSSQRLTASSMPCVRR
mgnify:CR=1 FL=1